LNFFKLASAIPTGLEGTEPRWYYSLEGDWAHVHFDGSGRITGFGVKRGGSR
jgi:hypothetical protein